MARRRLGFWRCFSVAVVKPPMVLLTRRAWRGAEHIPSSGPAIIVANHLSQADPLAVAHFVYEAGRWPQFLGKASLFRIPVLGFLLQQARQIPVHRGTADAVKALEHAQAAIAAGDAVIIYPEGTTTREPNLWPMRGKTGVARLALLTGAPVIPLAIWGPQKIFDPRTQKLRLFPRARMTLAAGPPIDLSRWEGAPATSATLNEITDAMMNRLRDMLAELRDEPAPPLWSASVKRAIVKET